MMPTPWGLKLWYTRRRDSSSLVHVLLQDRRVAAAELGRIAGHQPAVVEHQPLPATGPRPERGCSTTTYRALRPRTANSGRGRRRTRHGRLRRRRQMSAARHSQPVRKMWKDFHHQQNENSILTAEKVTISDTLAARGSRTAMARRSPVQSVHVLTNRQASEPPVTSPSEEPAWKQRAVERSIKTAKLRAAQRVQRFLDAAQAIIIEKGSTDFTVQEVVDRSRQSLRSFYLQFDGKHELLLALFEDALSRSADQIRAATANHDDPMERLKVAIQLLFESSRPDPTGQAPAVHRLRAATAGVASVRGQGRPRTAARPAHGADGGRRGRRPAASQHQSEADGGDDDADRDVQRRAVQW